MCLAQFWQFYSCLSRTDEFSVIFFAHFHEKRFVKEKSLSHFPLQFAYMSLDIFKIFGYSCNWIEMASTPKMEYQVFICFFQKNSAMATLDLKEMGKFLWEGWEKGLPCWLSQFSFANWAKNFPYLPKGFFWFPSNLR